MNMEIVVTKPEMRETDVQVPTYRSSQYKLENLEDRWDDRKHNEGSTIERSAKLKFIQKKKLAPASVTISPSNLKSQVEDYAETNYSNKYLTQYHRDMN